MSSASMSWYRITLSRQDAEAGEPEIVRAAFRGAYIARNGPRGAVLYGGWDDARNTYRLYFTPSAHGCARALLKVYAGAACDPPDTRRLDWLYGDPGPLPEYGVAF